MEIDEITRLVTGFAGVLAQCPRPGDPGVPEIAWGDTFFFYAPDGELPRAQPFATIVTKDYPGDAGSRLRTPGRFRLNIAAGAEAFTAHTGHPPRAGMPAPDPAATDTLFAHPLYGGAGWLAVVNPGAHTAPALPALLRAAHARARAAHERRHRPG
ncbi:DUF6194 family protein [Nocardia harenae]|uniref:DUF6194 family protein n=1 Tax=Nocardia harenae TaxID=358707 RepID=UPI00083125D3|nr:DUF6194 family protein [Nocardia harenae]